MSDSVRPIRQDLGDEALFAGLEPAPPAPPTDQTLHAVTTAIRVMRAANLKLTFGFDQDDAERLWASKFAPYSATAIIEAAGEWIDSGSDEFPTLSEFETVVRGRQTVLDHPAPTSRPPGSACPECFATDEEPTDGFVTLSDPTVGGTGVVRPCSLCNPERYEAWERDWPRKAKVRR
ncbi:MAG: hypothetical protein KGH75_00205 [Rhodospirillales bacterium]|nr:hypothetical protein [Rhodospirillales bacterium]